MRLATEFVLAREWGRLVDTASGLGHTLTEPELDTEVSLVAHCTDCDVVFAVDGQERPYQFSAGLAAACSPVEAAA